ncbi:c-type cytochrome [Undibacterium terreum]|nr:cytochrome c [Undibacterium terreum]
MSLKRKMIGLGTLAAGGIAALAWALQPAIAPIKTTTHNAQLVSQGQRIVALGDCMVCHSSATGLPYAGGLPLRTPFGTIYSTNITPDPETGIGAWSLEAFRRAVRHGISRDGHLLYPAFPYIHYTRMTDQDIEAAYAYLMSRTPVRYTPPTNELLLPLRFRPSLAFWNLLYLHPGEEPAAAVATDSDRQIARGRYLVDSLGHCASCHTELNPIGGESKTLLGGGSVDGWEAPALTTLVGAKVPWTAKQLENYLRTGLSAEHGAAKGPMRAVTERLSEVPREDVQAIASYIMSVQLPHPAPLQPAIPSQLHTTEGATLFAAACASCHSASAPMSTTGKRPSLALSHSVVGDNPANLIQTMLGGAPWVTQSAVYMPPFADVLTDEQIVSIAQYVRVDIGKRPPWPELSSKVAQARKEIHP